MALPATVSSNFRYEQVAEHVRQLIQSGTYGSHQRLPSVRHLSQQLQVSITTVLEAYRMLEAQGLVEARPQSGYYVLPPTQSSRPRPSEVVAESPINVGLGEFLMKHLRDFQRTDLVQFGCACPNPKQLPNGRLARCLARVSKEADWRGNSYDLPPGNLDLRIQIARRSLQAGCVVSPDDVLLTLGCQEALSLCLRATCKVGETVAVESPTFYGHLQAIEMLGLKALEVPSDPHHGISLASLQKSLEEVKLAAVLLCTNYSNPTGSSLSPEDKLALLDLLGSRGIPLIEDDIFGDLSHLPQRPHAAKALDRRDQVLLCSSFSKTLAPGYRVGWVTAGPRYMPRLQQLKMFSNLSSPTLPAMALAEFLTNGGFDHHLRLCRRQYALQVHQMAEAVLRHFPTGTRVTRPDGGFVLWVELPEGIDTRLHYPRALELGLTYGPGPIFSARGRFRNCLRLCAPYWSAETEPHLSRLGELFRLHSSKTARINGR